MKKKIAIGSGILLAVVLSGFVGYRIAAVRGEDALRAAARVHARQLAERDAASGSLRAELSECNTNFDQCHENFNQCHANFDELDRATQRLIRAVRGH